MGASRSTQERPDRRVAEIAAGRHGVFSRAQASGLGFTDTMIKRRLDAGRWRAIHPGVYLLAGAPHTWQQDLIAACLAWGPGSAVSHRAAASLWELSGFKPGLVELIVPRGRRRSLPGILHRPLDVLPSDVTIRDRIPVTKPARTLLDLASVVPSTLVETALDDALRRGLVSVASMRQRHDIAAKNGRPGIAVLRRLLDERAGAWVITDSDLETQLLRRGKRAGLPDPVVHHKIRDNGRVIAVVDFAYPDALVAIEADGYRWHSSRSQWERDLARRNAITALGWQVIHVTWADVMIRPAATVALIARTVRARLGDPARHLPV